MPAARRSFWAAVEHRLVSRVAVDEFDRLVWARRERDIAHQRPARELTFDMGEDAVAVPLGIQDGADADIGDDLLRRNLHFGGVGVSAVTFAGDVLRVVSGQWKIVVRQGGSSNCGYGNDQRGKHKYSASSGRTYDFKHAISQRFARTPAKRRRN